MVSVIIPAYNLENNISYCLDSIISQSYKNLEIICVDDKSTDKTLDVIKAYAKKDNRIICIAKEKNAGVSQARNTALDIAKGDYISFVDADDFIAESFYERLVELIQEHCADIARCRGRGVESYDYKEPALEKEPVVKTRSTMQALDIYYDGAFYGWYADDASTVCNCLFNKKVLNSLRFDKNLLRGEDECFIQQAIGEAEKIVYTDERLYFYYHRQGSASHSPFSSAEKIETIKLLYAAHQKYFKKMGYEAIKLKNLKAASDNFMEAYLSTQKGERQEKRAAKELFLQYYNQLEEKPLNLKIFKFSPAIYKALIKIKK